MILVVGGAGSGKLGFARRELGLGEADIADAILDGRPCLYHLEALVERELAAGRDPSGLTRVLAGKRVVICDEVGCGLIPLDPDRAAWREAVGRLCCDLAAQAQTVIRLTCGIPETIKGRLPSRVIGG